jgi:hypothetical protein
MVFSHELLFEWIHCCRIWIKSTLKQLVWGRDWLVMRLGGQRMDRHQQDEALPAAMRLVQCARVAVLP